MVYVKDEPFPRCIIIVVREALVALGNEAIGAHLRKNGGGAGTGQLPPGTVSPFVLVLALGLWMQVPWVYMFTPVPTSGFQPHLVTEMKGRKQQEGAGGGAVYSPVDSVQGL